MCGEGWGVRLYEPGSPGWVGSPAILRVEMFWVRPQEIPDVGVRWSVSTAKGLLAPKITQTRRQAIKMLAEFLTAQGHVPRMTTPAL